MYKRQGLYNADCSVAPVLIFLEDHKAETLSRAVTAAEDFAAQHNTDELQVVLAAGNAGIEAATNEVIAASETTMLIAVYAAVSIMCLLTFRSLAATLCVILPLVLTSVLGLSLIHI